jgi:thiamine kinase-like enzyme
MNYWIKRLATAFLSTLCSCGTPHIDKKYAAKVVKDALSLSCDVTAQKLSGGFTGAPLFKVTADTKHYVVRFLMHKTKKEREREIAILQIASKGDYGPHVYFADVNRGVVIMEFLQQQPIEQQARQADSLHRLLAQLLQKIHQGPAFEAIEERNVFNAIPAIIQNLQQHGSCNVPLKKLQDIVTIIHQAVAPSLISVPCHNDLHPSNLIFLVNCFKAIDYERAAQADPYFDIAMVAYAYCEKPENERILLSTYLGRQPTEIEIAKLYLFKQIAWMYCAVCFLTMIPDHLANYDALKVSTYADLWQERIDLEKPEHKLKFAKVLINHVIANVASQGFANAIELLHRK